eukprot:CAMPEP_0185904010 /NCGR_PEP_ID=MMETSP0196C-20130402/3305_1 /TAXON_ID=2932 /ORGANISM="Alexandrium fundyense, Strain CCMP1719" /LENGTH=32 /DNA_ID= /DNA_START= /DNA_END= /DNA_ORIENTATION=
MASELPHAQPGNTSSCAKTALSQNGYGLMARG